MDTVRFRLRVFVVVLVLVAVVLVGTVGFMAVEGMSLSDAFYFSIVTIATVGYGDIHPTTQSGKALALVLIVMGVGTFLGVMANATEVMLNRREKQALLRKINIVIGVFVSEVGTGLLGLFSSVDPQAEAMGQELLLSDTWTDKDFAAARKRISSYDYCVSLEKIPLDEIKAFLGERRDLTLRLLENPHLLEHELFTDLLRAISHLNEELIHRDDISRLSRSDLEHLAGDITRAYSLHVIQWVDNYMHYLKDHYPYLFSLAVRTNPFNRDASVVVG